MVIVAPAWDNERTASSTEPFHANHGQQSKNAPAHGGKHEIDICQPALAATITRDAERLCSQQRERTSQAMETALAEVSKAERAAHKEAVRHQLNDDGQARVWAPHSRNGQPSQHRKANVGRAAGVPSTPHWAQEFHEMRRRVSWATALESTIEDEPSPFPSGAPLQPPLPLPARRGSIVSAVLALAESPPSPPSTSPEGNGTSGGEGGGADRGPVVLDDDWVVRKLAQIRRRSRNIDAAIPLSDMHVPKRSPAATTAATSTTSNNSDGLTTQASEKAPIQIGGVVTLQSILPRAKPSGDGLYAEHNDRRLTPLPPLGESVVDVSPSAPKTSGERHQNGIDETGTTEAAVGQEGSLMMPISSSERSDIVPGRNITRHHRRDGKSPNGDEVATRDGGSDRDSVSAAVAEDDRGRRTGSAAGEGLRPTDIQQASREGGAGGEGGGGGGGEHLHDVTSEERALSLPSSSLLAADGSGELGLVGRSVRWGGGHDAYSNGKDEGVTVWSNRWKQKEADEIAAKEAAKKAKNKRAKMVLEVLARSEKIFRSNAEKRRRRSADDITETRALERPPVAQSAKPRVTGGGAVTTRRDERPTTSPITADCRQQVHLIRGGSTDDHDKAGENEGKVDSGDTFNDSGSNDNNPQPRRKLSAYIRRIKESSFPALSDSSNNGNPSVGQAAVSDEEKACADAAAVEGAPVVQPSERRESAVALAAKRVAMRKRKERAERDARIREETAKREAKRAFEGSLRAIVVPPSTSSARASRVPVRGRKAAAGQRRSSAPSCISSPPSAPSSGLSLVSSEGEKPPADGLAIAARDAGSTGEVRVRVRVPVASHHHQEEGTAPTAAAQEPTGADNLLDPLSPRCGRPRAVVEATSVVAKTTQQRLRDRRRSHRREKEEEEKKEDEKEHRTSRLLEELQRKRQESIASSEARRRHDASERRRSARQMELERREQLEQLEVISRQDARLSASARSMARHRIKAAALVAARTAANASSAAGGGGGGPPLSLSVPMRQQRKNSSFGTRAADNGVAVFDPRARRNSSPVRVDGTVQRTVSDSRPGGGRVGGLATDVSTPDYSGGHSADGYKQQRRLGLSERRKRRRKRQQRSSRQKKSPPRRSDFLDNDIDNGNDNDYDNDYDVDANGSDGVDDVETRITSSSKWYPPKAVRPPEPPSATGDSRNNNAVGGGNNRARSAPAAHPEDGTAQQKGPGAGRGVGGHRQEVNFKPAAEGRHTTRRKRVGSATDISAPRTRTEEKPETRRRQRETSEHLQVGGGGGGGGVEEKEKGFESRAAAAVESRFRRSRRRKSQESKKRGDTVAATGPKDRGPAFVKPDHEGNFCSAAKHAEESTLIKPQAENVRGGGSGSTGGTGVRGGDKGAGALLPRRAQGNDNQDEDANHMYSSSTLQRSVEGAAGGGAETGREQDLDGLSERGRPGEPRGRAASGEHESVHVNIGGIDSLYQRSAPAVEPERERQEVQTLERNGAGDVGCGGARFAPDPVVAGRGMIPGEDEQGGVATAVVGATGDRDGDGDVAGVSRYSCSRPMLFRILEEHGEEGEDDHDED